METKAVSVQVAIKLCGVMIVRDYSIRTRNNQLMTRRLEQLIRGNLGSKYGYDDRNIAESVGIIWRRPYTILRELVADRVAMQAKILALDGHSALTDIDECLIPEEAPDQYITDMVRQELRWRRALKQELRMLAKR